jgi:hypothetical protein
MKPLYQYILWSFMNAPLLRMIINGIRRHRAQKMPQSVLCRIE